MKKVILLVLAVVFAMSTALMSHDMDMKKSCKGMAMGKSCGMGMCPLMGDDRDVVVTNTKDGVQIVINAKDKSKVKELQEQIGSCMKIRQAQASSNPAVKESKADGNLDEMVQCPVMGTKFKKKDAYRVYEYKGKKYYICCPMCEKPFTTDPDKYAK